MTKKSDEKLENLYATRNLVDHLCEEVDQARTAARLAARHALAVRKAQYDGMREVVDGVAFVALVAKYELELAEKELAEAQAVLAKQEKECARL